jgi:hypothetical protein
VDNWLRLSFMHQPFVQARQLRDNRKNKHCKKLQRPFEIAENNFLAKIPQKEPKFNWLT